MIPPTQQWGSQCVKIACHSLSTVFSSRDVTPSQTTTIHILADTTHEISLGMIRVDVRGLDELFLFHTGMDMPLCDSTIPACPTPPGTFLAKLRLGPVPKSIQHRRFLIQATVSEDITLSQKCGCTHFSEGQEAGCLGICCAQQGLSGGRGFDATCSAASSSQPTCQNTRNKYNQSFCSWMEPPVVRTQTNILSCFGFIFELP